jgi:type II secretory pathway component PulF
MPVYAYRAIDLDASELSGTVVADTPRQARDVLRQRGLTVTRMDASRQQAAGRLWRRKPRRADAEVSAFLRELATLQQSAIQLLPALETLAQQHGGRFRAVVQDLGDQVAGGASLADAMDRHDAYFDTMALSIIRVGESTGNLGQALSRLADFREKGQRLKSRIVTALMYPGVVMGIGLLVAVFLMTYVVPSLVDALSQSGKPLPAVTQTVKFISDFLLRWWWALLLGGAGISVGSRLLLTTQRGSRIFDRLVLRIPLVGELIRKENTSRMAVVLEALLSSGLDFVEAVRITRQTVRNRTFRDALADYEQAVSAGGDVAEALRASGVFRPLVVQMLAVGQESGDLETMLAQLADAYDREVAIAAQRLTAVLEPLLIVLLAIVVGFIVFATVLPIMEVSNVL